MNRPFHHPFRGPVASCAGSALSIAMVCVFICSAVAAGILQYALAFHRMAQRQWSLERAALAAEAGMEHAAEYIEARRGYIANSYTDSRELPTGTFEYTVTKTGWREFSVRSVGNWQGAARQVTIDRVYFPSYADYALWSHENGVIYFIPGEEFFGKVHADDKVWFSSNETYGGPIFHERLSTGADEFGGDDDYVTFEKGFRMNTYEGSMASVDFADLKTQAQGQGLVLEGHTDLWFDSDGYMRITNARKGWSQKRVPIGEDQLVYVADASSGWSQKEGYVKLHGGVVDGRVTIATDDDILIDNHVVYNDDPLDLENPSDDALGLIAKDDVWVSPYSPNNLNIHAAIMATGQKDYNRGSFGVLNYDSISVKGELRVVGSIIQDQRGAVGTFNYYGPASGFYKNYAYDKRFTTHAPPYYPPVDERITYEGWSDGPA